MAAPWARGAQARIVGKIQGQDCINVFHFATNTVVNDGPPLDTLLLQLAEALLDCAVTTLLPGVTSDYSLVQCDAKMISPAHGDPIIATANPGSVGQRGATEVSFASSLVNVRTGGGGRRGRGRMFLPPAGEADITNSALDNATILLITAFLTCMAGKFLNVDKTTDWTMGVLSPTTLKAAGGTFDNSFRVVTSFNPVADVAVMRSRRKGKGR
jgi:hypothetical protein